MNIKLIGILFFGGLFFSNAHGYIDPGTGSMIVQVIIGLLVGIGVTIKVYWTKVKYTLYDKFVKSRDDK